MLGLALPALFAIIPLYSRNFRPETWEEGFYGLAVVGILVTCGGLCLVLSRRLERVESSAGLLAWIFVIGLTGRLLCLAADPPLETDFYRYQWDGALVAHGISPYKHPPQEVLEALKEESTGIPDTVLNLAQENRESIERINHPHLRTIYPPLAQAFFAGSYWIAPFSNLGLRVMSLLLELCLLAVMTHILKQSGKSLSGMVLLWWNPLIWYELYFRMHYDMLLLPLLLGFIWLLYHGKVRWAAVLLGLCAATRLWPILLTPFLLLNRHRRSKPLWQVAGILALSCLVLFLPYLPALTGTSDSGLHQYMQKWEANGFAFAAFRELGWTFKDHFAPGWDGRLLARIVTMLGLLAFCIWTARKPTSDFSLLCARMGLIILMMLLLSPAVYPWYYTALLPLAVFAPLRSLRLWTALLPASYLVWLVKKHVHWNPELLWGALLHLPVWILMFREWSRFHLKSTGSELPSDVP